jgi:hypothetical protein
MMAQVAVAMRTGPAASGEKTDFAEDEIGVDDAAFESVDAILPRNRITYKLIINPTVPYDASIVFPDLPLHHR